MLDNIPSNYVQINKELWNEKTKVHVDSEFYDNESFLKGRSSLNKIELDLLGDVKGKKILHLQCHFGQDTISLARMGANVTGVDISDEALKIAIEMNKQLGTNCEFICSDIYDLPKVLDDKFDIVFASYGVIGWHPSADKFLKVVKHFLAQGGNFIFAEFHPVVWMFDYDLEKIAYYYFNKETIVEESEGTYTDRKADMKLKEISWNHSLDEVLGSVLSNGMTLNSFKEYDYSPYNCFKNMIETESGQFQFKHQKGKVPIIYSLVATNTI